MQPFSAPQVRRPRPASSYILVALIVLALGAGGGWYWKHHHAAASATKAAPTTKPVATKPDDLQVTPDPDHKAFVISCVGLQVKAHGVKNRTRQQGSSVQVLVNDWKRTSSDLATKAELLCFAAPTASGRPIAHSDTKGHLSVPTGRPGLEYSLYYHWKDGSYQRQMVTFTVSAAPASKPATGRRRRR